MKISPQINNSTTSPLRSIIKIDKKLVHECLHRRGDVKVLSFLIALKQRFSSSNLHHTDITKAAAVAQVSYNTAKKYMTRALRLNLARVDAYGHFIVLPLYDRANITEQGHTRYEKVRATLLIRPAGCSTKEYYLSILAKVLERQDHMVRNKATQRQKLAAGKRSAASKWSRRKVRKKSVRDLNSACGSSSFYPDHGVSFFTMAKLWGVTVPAAQKLLKEMELCNLLHRVTNKYLYMTGDEAYLRVMAAMRSPNIMKGGDASHMDERLAEIDRNKALYVSDVHTCGIRHRRSVKRPFKVILTKSRKALMVVMSNDYAFNTDYVLTGPHGLHYEGTAPDSIRKSYSRQFVRKRNVLRKLEEFLQGGSATPSAQESSCLSA